MSQVPATHDRRQQILALEPRLLDCASSLTPDVNLAQALVRDTLKAARDADYGSAEGGDPGVWVFRLLRQRFHSLGRDGDRRRSRRALVTDVKYLAVTAVA